MDKKMTIKRFLSENKLRSPHVEATEKAVRKWVKDNPEKAQKVIDSTRKDDEP